MPAVRSRGRRRSAASLLQPRRRRASRSRPTTSSSRDGRIRSRDGALDVDVDRGDREARQRDDRRLGLARPEPRRRSACNTFGCQIAQVAVDPGTRRGARRADRRRARRRADRQPARRPRARSRAASCRGWRSRSPRSSSSTRPPASPSTAHLDDYKVPTIADVPEIVIDFVERPGPRTCRTSARRGSASRRSCRPPRRSRTRSRTRPDGAPRPLPAHPRPRAGGAA